MQKHDDGPSHTAMLISLGHLPPPGANEMTRADAINLGMEMGRQIGDELAADYAEARTIEPWMVDALRMELLFIQYGRVKAAEKVMLDNGVPEPIATAYRVAAACAVSARLKLAGVTTLATGPAN